MNVAEMFVRFGPSHCAKRSCAPPPCLAGSRGPSLATHRRALSVCVLRTPTLPVLPSDSRWIKARHLAETIAIGAGGGAVLGLLGMPAGWLSGAMLSVAIASLAGRPMY